jgi:hypothetical protein
LKTGAALNFTYLLALILIGSPVRGFLPLRAARLFNRKRSETREGESAGFLTPFGNCREGIINHSLQPPFSG